jgi:hypothetical protein
MYNRLLAARQIVPSILFDMQAAMHYSAIRVWAMVAGSIKQDWRV